MTSGSFDHLGQTTSDLPLSFPVPGTDEFPFFFFFCLSCFRVGLLSLTIENKTKNNSVSPGLFSSLPCYNCCHSNHFWPVRKLTGDEIKGGV